MNNLKQFRRTWPRLDYSIHIASCNKDGFLFEKYIFLLHYFNFIPCLKKQDSSVYFGEEKILISNEGVFKKFVCFHRKNVFSVVTW